MFDLKIPSLTRLEKEILAFEQQPIQKGLILFYGDSAFTQWSERFHHRPLEEEIRHKDGSLACVNHGFGTSTAEEQLYYYNRAVKPWAPRILVNLTFANDHYSGYSPWEIFFMQTRMYDHARADIPGIKFYICDNRPLKKASANTEGARNRQKEYNSLVRAYCAEHDDCVLVSHMDCPLFFEEGYTGNQDHLRTDIFVEDDVHYNQMGYDLYRDFFLKVLESEL